MEKTCKNCQDWHNDIAGMILPTNDIAYCTEDNNRIGGSSPIMKHDCCCEFFKPIQPKYYIHEYWDGASYYQYYQRVKTQEKWSIFKDEDFEPIDDDSVDQEVK